MNDKDYKRFMAKVDKTDDCWLWTAYKDSKGYGRFQLRGKSHRAHRVAYEHYVGPVPEGLQLDHLCRVRHCVNPDHLEPVTCKENTRRGDTGKAMADIHRAKTHCPKGHEYAGDNLYVTSRGSRQCKECKRERLREYRKQRAL